MILTGKVKSVKYLRGGVRVVINLGAAGEVILNGMEKGVGQEYVAGGDVAIEVSTTPVAPPVEESTEEAGGNFGYADDAGDSE